MKYLNAKLNLETMVFTIRKDGLRRAWQLYRWRLLLVIFLYYLIRDTILYIVLPFMIYVFI